MSEERTREFSGLGPLAGLAAAFSALGGPDFRTLRALVEKYGVPEVRDALDKIEAAREPRT